MDLKEALDLAAHVAVRPTIELEPLAAVNETFARMKGGTLSGRVVLSMRSP